MIDRKKFNETFVYLDKEIMVEIIDIFLGEYPDRFSALQKNIREQDFKGLKFNAHSLKGVIANFMDPVTIDLSRQLDEKAKNEDGTGLQELYDNLKRQTDLLVQELNVIKKELTS